MGVMGDLPAGSRAHTADAIADLYLPPSAVYPAEASLAVIPAASAVEQLERSILVAARGEASKEAADAAFQLVADVLTNGHPLLPLHEIFPKDLSSDRSFVIFSAGAALLLVSWRLDHCVCPWQSCWQQASWLLRLISWNRRDVDAAATFRHVLSTKLMKPVAHTCAELHPCA